MRRPSRSRRGFWTTTLGVLTQAAIALSAIAAIAAALVDPIPEGSPPLALTPTPPAPGLPASCGRALASRNLTTSSRMPELIGSIRVHAKPTAIATGGHATWVAHADGRVTKIDYATSAEQVTPLPGTRIGSERNGELSIAYGYGAAWITKQERGAGFMARIDAAAGTQQNVPLKLDKPDTVAAAGGFIWVTDDHGRLTRIDPSDVTEQVTEPIGGEPHGLWVGAPCAYVATGKPDGFVAFDMAAGTPVENGANGLFSLPAPAGEIAGGAGALWAIDRKGERVLRVDPDTPYQTDAIKLGFEPAKDALAASEDGVWTADGDHTVVRIDPQRRAPQPVDVPGGPWAIAVSDKPALAWVALRKSGEIARVAF